MGLTTVQKEFDSIKLKKVVNRIFQFFHSHSSLIGFSIYQKNNVHSFIESKLIRLISLFFLNPLSNDTNVGIS